MSSLLLGAIAKGMTIVDLAQPLEVGAPSSPNHPQFRMALQRRHGDLVRPDGSSAANELIVTGGHVGTHVDALAHVSFQGKLHGDIPVEAALSGGRFVRLGIDEMAPVVGRGVLLDVAATKGLDVLPAGYGITARDLDEAASRAGVEVRSGDTVLVRSGWARLFSEPTRFIGLDDGVPGPDESAADWLVDHGVRVTGADTLAYERIPAGEGHRLLPAHRILLVDNGIHIIEVMNLEQLSIAKHAEFVFVLAPLRIIGATGSPVRPIALLDP